MGTVTEVRAAAAEDFDSRQSALAARDGLLSRLDALASDFGGQVGGDPVVAAARSARLALATDLTTRAGALPSLRAVAPVAPGGSLLMAQRLYGDATRAPELVARNQGKVRHPLFLPPGEDLEALER
jgi:prophage DNA circulation protein